jgi:hypothetical protein
MRPTARRLFGVFGGPGAWSLQLLVSYAVVTAGCSTRWDGTGRALVAITVACAAAAIASAVAAWRERSEREATAQLLGTIGLGLALLFLGVIVLGGVGPALVELC